MESPSFALTVWLLIVSSLSVFNTVSCFLQTDGAMTRMVYSLKQDQGAILLHLLTTKVSPLMNRMFGLWTLLASLIRIRCALDLTNKSFKL